jgi:hypothetical protein
VARSWRSSASGFSLRRVVLACGARGVGGAHGRHQVLPGGLEQAAALRRLGHGDAELAQQGVVGCSEPERGQQPVELGALEFDVAVLATDADGLGVGHRRVRGR